MFSETLLKIGECILNPPKFSCGKISTKSIWGLKETIWGPHMILRVRNSPGSYWARTVGGDEHLTLQITMIRIITIQIITFKIIIAIICWGRWYKPMNHWTLETLAKRLWIQVQGKSGHHSKAQSQNNKQIPLCWKIILSVWL